MGMWKSLGTLVPDSKLPQGTVSLYLKVIAILIVIICYCEIIPIVFSHVSNS